MMISNISIKINHLKWLSQNKSVVKTKAKKREFRENKKLLDT